MKVATDEACSQNSEAVNQISGIWNKILEVDSVGPKDDFFDLGGNSMLLIAMLEVVQDKFKKDIALQDLSDGVTIGRLAQLVV